MIVNHFALTALVQNLLELLGVIETACLDVSAAAACYVGKAGN